MAKPEHLNRKKVYVALSGGVDSAVAALLLKQKGYDVTGIYMKTWSPPGYPCPWKEEKRDALRVCAHLQIPFKMWDFTSDYKTRVVDYMIGEYAKGRTPNPDVMCNKEIKFGLFFNEAMRDGADFIATGHYAKVLAKRSGAALYKSNDQHKDQSYFLWTLTQKQLEKTLMPIGEFNKKETVRTYARTYGLPVSEKKDSQGVCFIGPINVHEFLAEYIPKQKGLIKAANGRILGSHEGLPFYTLGQKSGVGGQGPYYVAAKEVSTNTLVVASPADEQELYADSFSLSDANFIEDEPDQNDDIEVSVRYGQEPVPATYKGNGMIKTKIPLRAVTGGQSAVMYCGKQVIGGGIIENIQ